MALVLICVRLDVERMSSVLHVGTPHPSHHGTVTTATSKNRPACSIRGQFKGFSKLTLSIHFLLASPPCAPHPSRSIPHTMTVRWRTKKKKIPTILKCPPSSSASAWWFLRSHRPQATARENYSWHVFNHPPLPIQDNEQHLTSAPYVCNMAAPRDYSITSQSIFKWACVQNVAEMSSTSCTILKGSFNRNSAVNNRLTIYLKQKRRHISVFINTSPHWILQGKQVFSVLSRRGISSCLCKEPKVRGKLKMCF